jgi:serine/threonine protein kinase
MTTCPPSQHLAKLLTGELSEADQTALDAHLAACAACQQVLARLSDGDAVGRWRQWCRSGGDRQPEKTTCAGPAVGGEVMAPPVLPGYEILGELGRGGMGVVYKARQVKLNRLVALKLLRVGGAAGPEELARFFREAEAVARLQHPHIVQIHEILQTAGTPVLCLEYVGGASLAGRLAGTPQPARDAAHLVETLARAIHFAHQRGVIHRDLKPANVLLASSDPSPGVATPGLGTTHHSPLTTHQPKITDFGLAKCLDADSAQTQSGAVVGTPGYMAPEQARGETRAIGPPADVYALGAILYEMLTGRPPFRAATPFDTLLQVVHQEPVPPGALQKVPRDLETICLKCLHKEPHRRYATAQDLADDLRRYQEGRPVAAQPVGRWERAAKWARRNPALAGAVAAVAAALLAGTAVSSYFAVEATQKADALAKANESLTVERDNLELTLARSSLRPLAVLGGDKPVSDPEWKALWDLAANRPGRLGYRFVEEAARDPVFTRQLRDRAAVALDAAVGLDALRRDEVEALLLTRLDDPAAAQEQKTDLALAASAWGALRSPAAARVARQLALAIADARDVNAVGSLSRGLAAAVARLDSADAAATAATLTRLTADAKDALTLSALHRELPAVAARLGPADAAALAATLTAALKDPKNLPRRSYLAQELAALAARLEPGDAATAAATLAQLMEETKDAAVVQSLVQALAALADRLEPGAAAATLTRLMKEAPSADAARSLAEALAAVAGRLDAREAAAAVASAARRLTELMRATKDALGFRSPAHGVARVAAYLAPADAAAVAADLTRLMKETKDAFTLQPLAEALAAAAAHLEARDAAAVAADLTRLMDETKAPYTAALQPLAYGLSAVPARLAPGDAADNP